MNTNSTMTMTLAELKTKLLEANPSLNKGNWPLIKEIRAMIDEGSYFAYYSSGTVEICITDGGWAYVRDGRRKTRFWLLTNYKTRYRYDFCDKPVYISSDNKDVPWHIMVYLYAQDKMDRNQDDREDHIELLPDTVSDVDSVPDDLSGLMDHRYDDYGYTKEECIRMACSTLSEHQQTITAMLKEDKSYAEVSRELGISRSAVSQSVAIIRRDMAPLVNQYL